MFNGVLLSRNSERIISAHGFSRGAGINGSLMVTDLSVFTRTAKNIEKIKTAKAVNSIVPGIIPTDKSAG